MDNVSTIMDRWEEVLNDDKELEERNKSMYSSVEGRIAIQIEVEGQPSYKVEIKGGRFKVQKGSAETAYFCLARYLASVTYVDLMTCQKQSRVQRPS